MLLISKLKKAQYNRNMGTKTIISFAHILRYILQYFAIQLSQQDDDVENSTLLMLKFDFFAVFLQRDTWKCKEIMLVLNNKKHILLKIMMASQREDACCSFNYLYNESNVV